MKFNIYDRLKDSSYADGKFLSDKSYAYDTVYFIAKFIYEYAVDMVFDYGQWKSTLEDFIAEKWQLLDKKNGLLNYYHETISLLEYSHVVVKEKRTKVKIIDANLINFITKDNKMENAYIYGYLLCYFTIKNSGCLDSYINFCKTSNNEAKKQYVLEIYNCLCNLNSSVKNPEEHKQWARQNTQYIMNVLNFINKQPWITREFTLEYKKIYKPRMISVNVPGTKTKYAKKNEYLANFDYNYVISNLIDYMIEGEE